MTPLQDELRSLVERRLAGQLEAAVARLTAVHADLAPVAELLRGFLAGGKRMRPVLLLLGHRAGGGASDDAVVGPALGLELLHACALLHDDVIDRAESRRGQPAVHVTAAGWHAHHAWRGSADAYGMAAAILLGDLAFALADECFLTAEVASDRLLDGFRAFTVMREEVMAGQFLDVHTTAAPGDPADAVRRALTVALLKSGRYSVSRPLEIGARLAGADPVMVQALVAIGDRLGTAFQLTDDLLGVFGDEDETGKPVGSDLREGKRTLLVVETLRRLGPLERAEFERLLGSEQLEDGSIKQLVAQIEGSGARHAVEEQVVTEIDAARGRIRSSHLDAAISEELEALADAMAARRR